MSFSERQNVIEKFKYTKRQYFFVFIDKIGKKSKLNLL